MNRIFFFYNNLGTVNGPLIPEMTILEAYQKLRLAVYATKFMVQVEFDNQEVYYFLLTRTQILDK